MAGMEKSRVRRIRYRSRCRRARAVAPIDATALHRPGARRRRQNNPGRVAGPGLRGKRKVSFMPKAYSITVRGVVQGVGFRPFVYRLARAHDLKGWVLNAEHGVRIHLEGAA